MAQVFGFISSLIENDHAKVILVANESEIRDDLLSALPHERYMNFISVMDKLELPEIEKERTLEEMFPSLNREADCTPAPKEIPKISDIRKYVDTLFPPDEQYRRIKEKIIGQTFSYTPAMDELVPKLILINQFESSTYVKNHLCNCIAKAFGEHANLRTVQKLGQYLCRALPTILSIMTEVFEVEDTRTLDRIVAEISQSAIQHSKDAKADTKQSKATEQENPVFRTDVQCPHEFADAFFSTGVYNEEAIKEALRPFVQSMYRDTTDPQNPLRRLSSWYAMDDSEAEKVLSELDKAFFEGRYHVSDYPQILCVKLDLESLGFENAKNIKSIVEEMCENVRKIGKFIDRRYFHNEPQIKNLFESYKKYLDQIEEAAKQRKDKPYAQAIESALQNGKLVDDSLKNLYGLDYRIEETNNYFALVDLDLLDAVLAVAHAKDIWDFRTFLSGLYGREKLSKDFSQTIEKICQFVDRLSDMLSNEPNPFRDKIARQMCNWLCQDFKRLLPEDVL